MPARPGLIDPHLKRGEKIIWQGQPVRRLTPGVGAIFPVLFGLVFTGIAGFAVFKMAEKGGLFTLGLIFIGVGLSVILHALFTGMLIRRWSRYALTNRRAYIWFCRPFIGPRVHSWPITGGMRFHTIRPAPLSIYFAEFRDITINGRSLRIGFQRIADGEAVLKLMQELRDKPHGSYSYAAPKPKPSEYKL